MARRPSLELAPEPDLAERVEHCRDLVDTRDANESGLMVKLELVRDLVVGVTREVGHRVDQFDCAAPERACTGPDSDDAVAIDGNARPVDGEVAAAGVVGDDLVDRSPRVAVIVADPNEEPATSEPCDGDLASVGGDKRVVGRIAGGAWGDHLDRTSANRQPRATTDSEMDEPERAVRQSICDIGVPRHAS